MQSGEECANPNFASRSVAGLAVAITTQQISHYHLARYRAIVGAFARLTIVSAMNDADFPAFLSQDDAIDTVRLFSGRAAYIDAVARGRVWSAMHAALDRVRPQAVAVAGWSFPESLSAIAWASDHDARVVMMSDSQHRDAKRMIFREAIKSRIVRACDAALVGGHRHAQYIESLGIRGECVFQGYDVVDNRHFAEGADLARARAPTVRQTHGLPERYILASARFIPKKNLHRLVEAFGLALARTVTSHSLVILGDGPGRPALQSAIVAAGLGHRVLLPGFKTYDSLPSYYGLADAFALVSLTEQWGLVINEAAAAGLPLIVSHPCGAVSELVKPGINGILVEPTDIEGMARALHEMMSAAGERRTAMGQESRRIVANWGPERFAQGLHCAFAAAVAHPRQRLALADRLVLRALSRRYHLTVS